MASIWGAQNEHNPTDHCCDGYPGRSMGLDSSKTGRGYNVSGRYSVARVGRCVGMSGLMRCDMAAFLLYSVLGALALFLLMRDEDWED